MKSIICGDTHVGAVFGLGRATGSGGNTRVDDYERSLNFIIDYAINNEVEVFIQTGDLFEVRNPTTEHIQIADRAIKRLSDANIFTVIIMGNHDYRKTGDTYTSALATMQANSYKNVRILLRPESIIYSNKKDESQAMLFIPYRDKRMYSGSTTKECTDLFNNHLKEMASRLPADMTSIAVGHNFFFEGSYFDYGGHEVLVSPDSLSEVDMVVMGHHHEFRRIRKSKPAAYYVGSLEKTNFGDSDVNKFFILFDSQTKEVEQIKIPTRELLDLSIDLSSSTAFTYLQDYGEQLKKYSLSEKICRAKIKIKDGTQALFSKSEIEKTLYTLGAFHVSKILWDIEQVKLEKDKGILSHKTDFEIFEAFAKTQGLQDSFLQKLLEEAKKIMV
jgi:exonuclease SbcD